MIKNIAAFSKTFLNPWPARGFLCLAVLLSYASVWPNEFLFDDKYLIVLNEYLRHWKDLPKLLTGPTFAGGGLPEGFYRPVQMLIYFLIYQAFGASTIAFHALNVGLQALNACLLYHFGARAGFRKGAAFAAALLWAVHPLHTTIVTYMSSTAELLWSSFCLLGLIALLPDFAPRRSGAEQIPGAFAPRRSGAEQIPGAFAPRKVWKAMIFFVLALGCKETAVVFPALAVITLFFASKDRAQFSIYLKTWPLWLLAAGYIAVWLLFIQATGYNLNNSGSPMHFAGYMSSPLNRTLTSLASLPIYVGLIIWPVGLHIERSFNVFMTLLAWQPMTGALIVGLGLLQILWGQAKRGVALSFGLLWFAITLSPYTGIIIPVDALINEGWMYTPLMGLFLGLTQTVAGFFEKRQNAARIIVLVLALSLGAATFLQNEAWRNTETLYQSIAKNGGRAYQLSIPLGVFYLEHGEFDKAIAHFNVALDHSEGRPKVREETHLRLAIAWLHVRPDERGGISLDDVLNALPGCKHIPEAIRELGQILQENPDSYWAHAALAIVYRYQGNNQMADFHQKQVGVILQKQGNPGQ